MLAKPEIACAIIEGISSVREDEELQDFVVEVEGKEFKCHRLILSACSGFFRGLLRSGMKETQQERTKLEGVSKETFTAILETLYTGCDNLTRDNMLNVWLAADQFEITAVFDNCVNFIRKNICNETVISYWIVASQLMHQNTISLCELFLRNNTTLENWGITYSTAHQLGSKLILSHVRDFIKKNYQLVIKSHAFLCLRGNDLRKIIKSQDLVVLTEDVVVESVLYWANNGIQFNSETMAEDLNETTSSFISLEGKEAIEEDKEGKKERGKGIENEHKNEKGEEKQQDELEEEEENIDRCGIIPKDVNEYRKKCLENLFSETRLCHVSTFALEKVSRDPFIINNKKSREMVMDAALYKSAGRQHGQWPKGAIHRICSGFENVGVVGSSNGFFSALSCHPKFQYFELPDCSYLVTCTHVKLIAYMTYFFAIGDVSEHSSSLCTFVQNEWREVKKLSGNGWLGVAVEEFIYLINSSNQHIKSFDPRHGNCLLKRCISFPTQDKVEHVCSLDLFILAFCSEVVSNLDETAVHCLDTRSQTWTRLDSLEGSAKYLVSFRKEKQLYVLQTNGNLWEVNRDQSRGIKLKLVGRLWHGKHEMHGALCYNGRLCIDGSILSQDQIIRVHSTVFPKFVLNCHSNISSNIVPVILERSNLSK